jgi:nitrile hydratase
MARGTSAERPVRAPARFEVGQRVRARQMHPTGHTRLPRYVRGHIGTVQAVRGVHVLPDRHTAHPPTSEAEQGEWLYTVVFDARDLWGAQADPTVRVSVDAWEPYLEPVVTA